MIPFVYYSPTRFVFGKGKVNEVGKLAAIEGAKKALVVYGALHAKRTGLLQRVLDLLQKENISAFEFGGILPNPTDGPVKKGITLCKKERIDFILAVGGGSVIDAAKAIAMGALDNGELWDFYARKRMPQKALPIGVILTIPAAGSEASGNSVITQESSLLKRSATGECLRPKFSILDEELTYNLPLYQTSCGIVDMMSHIFERYFTNEQGVTLTDEMCEGVLRAIIQAGERIKLDLNDIEARATLLWAGTVAHVNILGLGRIEDWSVHALEHEMNALYGIAHGAGLAIAYPHWMRYQLQFKKERFARLAEKVWFVPPSKDLNEMALEGIHKLSTFWTSLSMPQKLSEIKGFKSEDIFVMAKKAKRSRKGELGNYNPLNDSQVIEVYKSMI